MLSLYPDTSLTYLRNNCIQKNLPQTLQFKDNVGAEQLREFFERYCYALSDRLYLSFILYCECGVNKKILL